MALFCLSVDKVDKVAIAMMHRFGKIMHRYGQKNDKFNRQKPIRDYRQSFALSVPSGFLLVKSMEKQLKIRDLRKKEQFIIDDQYLNGWAKKCGIYATGVYVSLCRHADKEQKSFPKQSTIATELKVSSKQVGRALDILESYRIIKRKRLGNRMTNRYYLLDRSEWTTSPISDRTTSPIVEDYQSNQVGLTVQSSERMHKKDAQEKEKVKKILEEGRRNLIANKVF